MSEPKPLTPRVTVPTPLPWTLTLRRLFPWQVIRFVVINLKMLRMIGKSHPHVEPTKAG